MKTLSYWARLARLFNNYRKKSSHLPYKPIRLWVELTSICNYRCIMCPNKDLPKENKGFMKMELYKKIVDEAAVFAFDINLAHRGESLLHPQLEQAIRYAKNKRLYTRLHTNGSLLTEELSHKLLASELDRISFSFDGYTKEVYENIRRGGDFDKTLSNIIRFLKIKKASGKKKPLVAIEVINFAETADEKARRSFQEHFSGLPLDNFVIKELHNWAGEIKKEQNPRHYSICPFPWNAMIINWDGSVSPCTQDFFGKYITGDANFSSLQEIWNSEKMIRLRTKLSRQDLDGLAACSGCDRLWRRSFLGVPIENLGKFLLKRMP